MSSSPKKFSNQGLVYLSEIESESDLGDLSVKQMKDILAMNRVAFKGVVEKAELHKIILRLWKQEKKQEEGKVILPVFYLPFLEVGDRPICYFEQ